MKVLIILNDAPYGSEKTYNALRLAGQLNKEHSDVETWLFLMADAVTSASATQTTPKGFYNIETMLRTVIGKGTKVKICGSCAEARGLRQAQLIEGTEISSMADLANWVVHSDKVLTF